MTADLGDDAGDDDKALTTFEFLLLGVLHEIVEALKGIRSDLSNRP